MTTVEHTFQVKIDVDGQTDHRPFTIAARTLTDAVNESLSQLMKEQPQAQFAGLTYFHPPIG